MVTFYYYFDVFLLNRTVTIMYRKEIIEPRKEDSTPLLFTKKKKIRRSNKVRLVMNSDVSSSSTARKFGRRQDNDDEQDDSRVRDINTSSSLAIGRPPEDKGIRCIDDKVDDEGVTVITNQIKIGSKVVVAAGNYDRLVVAEDNIIEKQTVANTITPQQLPLCAFDDEADDPEEEEEEEEEEELKHQHLSSRVPPFCSSKKSIKTTAVVFIITILIIFSIVVIVILVLSLRQPSQNINVNNNNNRDEPSQKNYVNNNNNNNREKLFLDKYRFIAHALGGINNHSYTNTLEAIQYNYQLGYRIFEVDLTFTLDNHLVCYHGGPRAVLASQNTRDDFLLRNLTFKDGKYTRMDLEQLFDLMKNHKYKDIAIVTDFKDNFELSLEYLVNLATGNRKFDGILNRVIPQIYHQDQLQKMINIYPNFNEVIYTLYLERKQNITSESISTFLTQNINHVTALTCPLSWDLSTITNALNKTDNVKLFVHTINDKNQIKQLHQKGIYGFYSDFIVPFEF